jgi:CubicO group peptidase (beta-lactamase class C family)
MPRSNHSVLRLVGDAVIILALTLSVVFSDASVQAKNLQKDLDEYLTAAHEVWKFHGTALVAKDGKVLFEKGYGMANIELGVPNTPEMKFQIGSITKQFTATAIMQLEEKGLLSLNDPITKHLPDYPKETGDKITIHNLLSHTAGIPNYTNMPDMMNKKAFEISVEDLMGTFKNEPLDFEPGDKYTYSNSNYVVLGAIIEKIAGETYEDYLQENIFEPLGMNNSGYDHRDVIMKNRAAGYSQNEAKELVNAEFTHMSTPYAAGALYSTVEDMLIWDQALYGEKILKKSSLDRMFTPVKGDYGYGWVIDEMYGRKHIWHNGGIFGFYTNFARWVDDKICVVVLSNNDAAPVDAITLGLSAIALGEPYDFPVKKSPIKMDPAIFADYEGVYQIEDGDYRFITADDTAMYSQRSGSVVLRVQPETEDLFYFDFDEMTTIKFVRDESGKVIRHIIHHPGHDAPAEKLAGEEAEKVLAEQEAQWEVAQVDPAIYEKYVGEYQLPIGMNMTVRSADGKIFVQATGQPEAELFPRSETEYFLKVVDAQITFVIDEAGKVTGMILRQNGQDFPGEKIK